MKTKVFMFILMVISTSGCGGSAENLTIGDKAPDFKLEDYRGIVYSLSDYKDKNPVVVYFYPKANTSGCTTQACGIRDNYQAFEENGIIIFGISVDDKDDLKDFIDEHNLNFPLLSDSEKKVSEKYGVLNNIGLDSRITFIIDKKGIIQKIIRDVDVDTHAEEALNAAKKLSDG